MSKKSEEQKNDEARKLLDDYLVIKEWKNRISFEEGRIMYEMFKDSLYKSFFGEDKYSEKERSWKRFCLEITGMPTSTADQKRKIYQKWIVELDYKPEELRDITLTKLYIAIPYAKDKKTADGILKFIRTVDDSNHSQPVTDFVEYLKEEYKVV
ncbi:MAG: hypothetical protein IPM48_14615 [Saprospiraceae bacterium]|nr:hypothetical protein [Saprospiraceae bacterium]